ncbi:MAG: hypothetical protein ACKO96_34170, partial [Flammeovirgaceae bacterium]
MIDQGHSVIRLGYKEVLRGPGKEIPSRIRNHEISGIVVNYKQWRKGIPEDMIDRFHKELSVWIKHAKQNTIPVYVFGFIGNHWHQYIWDQLVLDNEMFESK